MTVKDLIAELTNLPLDCEVDLTVVGADPANPYRRLHQFVGVDGWMVEHSSKGDHRRCCVVLKPVAQPARMSTLVDDYEDGTIQLSNLRRVEGDTSEPPADQFPDTFTHESFLRQLHESAELGSQAKPKMALEKLGKFLEDPNNSYLKALQSEQQFSYNDYIKQLNRMSMRGGERVTSQQ